MTAHQQQLLSQTVTYVKTELHDAEGGHDWFHIERVWKNAQLLAKTETVDSFVVELAALLHDIADSKFHQGDETIGPKKAAAFLHSLEVEQDTVDHVVAIIENISFKGGRETSFHSPEFLVVQDADRLDAIGAIGVARAFNYGGFKNRALYDPSIPPKLDITPTEYKASTAPTINHFYEKLLLLKDRMHTETGKKIAAKRHAFMQAYLEQFYQEWNGQA